MPHSLVYQKLPFNKAHRYNQRAIYDLEAIHTIINTTKVLHVSFNSTDPAEGPFPAILPMIGQMGSFAHPSSGLSDPLDCYLHGYVSARLTNLARSDGGPGFPVAIAATKVDGLVLSLTPFSHSYNYRSAVLFGYAQVVTDTDEKIWAMQLITESVIPGRWENTRTPPDGGEMGATAILRVKIAGGSGKINEGQPNDDKKDLGREDITSRVWAGVAPVWEVIGQPIASKTNAVKVLPEYIDDFVKEGNENNEGYAKQVATVN